jgi:hypothetical protein
MVLAAVVLLVACKWQRTDSRFGRALHESMERTKDVMVNRLDGIAGKQADLRDLGSALGQSYGAKDILHAVVLAAAGNQLSFQSLKAWKAVIQKVSVVLARAAS